MPKTKAQLEDEIRLIELTKEQRKICDELYAIKLVEKIVFGMVGLILVALVGAVIAGVLK